MSIKSLKLNAKLIDELKDDGSIVRTVRDNLNPFIEYKIQKLIYDDIIKHLSTRKKTQTLSCYTCTEFESATPTGKLLMVSNILLNGNIRVRIINK